MVYPIAITEMVMFMMFRKKSIPNENDWLLMLEEERGDSEVRKFIARVKNRYHKLRGEADTHSNRALQKMHLETNILPALAFYQELVSEGMEQEDAVTKTGEYLNVIAQKLRRQFQLTARLPFFFPILKRMMRSSMERNFPEPGFELEWPELGKDGTGFNVHRCFYADVLGRFGAPELTRLFCDMDDVVFENTPGVRWERKNTIGRGGEFCDFRYFRDEVDKT
jgi:hypothetical protein